LREIIHVFSPVLKSTSDTNLVDSFIMRSPLGRLITSVTLLRQDVVDEEIYCQPVMVKHALLHGVKPAASGLFDAAVLGKGRRSDQLSLAKDAVRH
jgi:hypothetical protein